MNQQALENVIAHVVATLPDSISQRKRLLSDVIQLLAPGSTRKKVFSLLAFLESHEEQQLEFASLFPSKK